MPRPQRGVIRAADLRYSAGAWLGRAGIDAQKFEGSSVVPAAFFHLCFRALACSSRFAFSSSRLRLAGRFLPARLMKNCTIRIPEPIPFGLTFLVAMTRAIVSASLVKRF